MKRGQILAAALVGTLLIAARVAMEDDGAAAVVPAAAAIASRSPSRAGSVPAPPPMAGDGSARTPWPDPEGAALVAWQPPAPQAQRKGPAPPQAPPAPEAPAFPYRWIGRLEEEGRSYVLLASEERTLAVRSGDVIDEVWRLGRVSERQVELAWLPGGQLVTLALR